MEWNTLRHAIRDRSAEKFGSRPLGIALVNAILDPLVDFGLDPCARLIAERYWLRKPPLFRQTPQLRFRDRDAFSLETFRGDQAHTYTPPMTDAALLRFISWLECG